MAKVSTYLNFLNNTEEVFNFYKQVFQTEFEGGIMRYGDVPPQEGMPPMSEEIKKLVMHVSLPITGGHNLMGSDTLPMGEPVKGSNVYICLHPDSRTEADRLFKAPSKRASTHNNKLSGEKPLIINPGKEDPSKFLVFHKEMMVAINDHPKGIETIKRTGLNRKEILTDRLLYLETLEQVATLARNGGPGSAKAKAHFKKIAKPGSIYSLMVRSNFPDLV